MVKPAVVHVRALALAAMLALAVPSVAAQVGPLPPEVGAVDQAVVRVSVSRTVGGRVQRGTGSGVIIDATGLLLTAGHVVDRMTRVEVVLQTGEALPARIVGTDRVYDVALLQVQAGEPLPVASLGSSGSLANGDPVVAVGRAPRRQHGPSSGTFLQTDYESRPGVPYLVSSAVVYPGDSGGALVNVRGDVVGIIVAVTRNGQVSLSLAADAVGAVMNDLRVGDVRHPWLGIVGRTITGELAAELMLPVQRGVLILDVLDASPASLAGLRGGQTGAPRDLPRGGDIIVAIDGGPVESFGSLAAHILGRRIGDTVTLEVLRDGQAFETTAVLAERPTL